MKSIYMQVFRSLVTFVVVGVMAVMIFSLRSELRNARAKLAGYDIGACLCTEPGLFDTIHTRTSIRAFDPYREVGDDDVERLLRAAMAAPTAVNKQPWRFYVVRDAATLSTLGEKLPHSHVKDGAKLAIVVCGLLDNGLEGRGKEYWIQDCSAATENLLLAAKALGLGAVWTGVYPGEDRVAIVRQALDIPDTLMPLNVIPIGYPAQQPEPKDKWDPAKVIRK